ncbi:MAG TPA: ferrochelatase [Acidimicrobiales bacterium]|nr:ferrochelatase [Acidimicrobiales bacterium]
MSVVKPVGVLVMAHGTPRSLDDLPAFYTEIRRGSPPPPELLADLERRYLAIGGTSPLNERTDAQVEGIRRALTRRAPGRFRVAAGAKFAPPRIAEAVEALGRAGVGRLVGLVLAPHFSAASVGDYERRARAAADALGPDQGGPLELEMIQHWHLAPGLVALLAARVGDAIMSLRADARGDAAVVFTAHSIPARLVDAGDPYPTQVHESAAAISEAAGIARWSVAWQSAGRTADAWLEPDVRAVIAELPRSGASGVVVCPVGFVSDHLEVLYDVDIEARAAARDAGLDFARTASLNEDPAFCDVLAGVVLNVVEPARA